jgi:integrase
MGHVEKRQRRSQDGQPGQVHWRGRYRDADGRERSESFERRVDAERFLERVGADIQRGEWIDPALRRARFGEWAEGWWATTVKLRPNTRRGYWLLLENHVLPYFGERRIAAIDYVDVERFIAEKIEAGHGPKHVREMVTVVSLVMRLAVKGGARRDNPAGGHSLRVPRRRLRQADMLTMDDVIRLLDHVPERYRAAVWLLVYTGIRPAELCGLRVRDVDFARQLVTVSQTRAPIAGYDGRGREHSVGTTKSEAGQRSIPLPIWLCEELAAGLAARGAPLSRDAPLIVNKDGRPVNRDTFRAKIIRPALRAAGLTADFRTYDFRHAHASMLIEDGASVLAVAERMGHTDPAVTLRVYGHLFEGVQSQLTDRLERRRQGARTDSPAQVVALPATAVDGAKARGPQMGRGGPRDKGL